MRLRVGCCRGVIDYPCTLPEYEQAGGGYETPDEFQQKHKYVVILWRRVIKPRQNKKSLVKKERSEV